MKSFGFTTYGGPEVLTEYKRPLPTMQPEQVLIKVAAFAVNPYDVQIRSGLYSDGTPLAKPNYLGADLVGQITAVGASVHDYQVGDWVINHRAHSGYSEYVAARPSKLMRRPLTLPLPIAASLPTPGIAAYNGWYHFAEIKPTDKIAIIGVTGAVGSLLAQIALAAGHHVVGVANHRHEKAARELGVTDFIAYDQLPTGDDWQHQATVVFNTLLGGHDHGLSDKLLAPHSQLICFNGTDVALTTPAVKKIAVGYRPDLKDQAAFQYWTKFLKERSLQLAIDQVRPATLANLQAAHLRLSQPHYGKQVLVWA